MFAILNQEWRLLRRDPTPLTILFLMPFIAIALFSPSLQASLAQQGYQNVSGAALATPGLSVLFASLGVSFLAYSLVREKHWQTWPRLRANHGLVGILSAKALPTFLLLFSQQILLLTSAIWLYDLQPVGSLWAYATIAAAFSMVIISIGLLITAVFQDMQKINAITHLGALAMAGLGGAFFSIDQLPVWLQNLAPMQPAYWVIQSQQVLILKGIDPITLYKTLSVLLTQAVLIFGLCVVAYRIKA